MGAKKSSKIVIKDKFTGKIVKAIENPNWENIEGTDFIKPSSTLDFSTKSVIPAATFQQHSLLNPDVVPVNTAKPCLPKDWGVKTKTVKPIRDTQRGIPQSRQTQEQYEREKALKESAPFVQMRNRQMFGKIAQEAAQLQSDFFKEELSYGLIKGLSRITLENKVSGLKAEYLKKIDLLKEDGKYNKYYTKLVKSVKKAQKKAYKKAKRKYGKKLAQLLFYEAQGDIRGTWTVEEPKSKEVKLLEEEYNNNIEKLEEEHKDLVPPRIDPSDLYLSVNTGSLEEIGNDMDSVDCATPIDASNEKEDFEQDQINEIIQSMKK